MRFQVSQVMDAIEERLTTDVAGAQAVVDLGEVVRHVALDCGRPVNLVRIGMVVDALSRYLVDGGAMLYGVVDRGLLSEQALTSKERMVLGRWVDDGLIEATTAVEDRPVEIAGMTGLPLIALRPMPELVRRYGWLADGGGRVLWLAHRGGVAVLRPMDDPGVAPDDGAVADDPVGAAVLGRARVPEQRTGPDPAAGGDRPAAGEPASVSVEPVGSEQTPVGDLPGETAGQTSAGDPTAEGRVAPEDGQPPEAGELADAGEPAASGGPDGTDQPGGDTDENRRDGVDTAGAQTGPTGLPAPMEAFADRGAAVAAVTRISWRRFRRTEPDPAHRELLTRRWRCDGFDCPVFGEHRRIGQPVPRLRDGRPVCPRHDQPVTDIGPRPPAYPVSIVIDDLPRRRLVVRAGEPISVGRDRTDHDRGLVSVAQWLHSAAAAWISPVHLRLAADGDGLTVTDLSDNGTVVWQRKGPDDPGTTMPLYGGSQLLGEWDSVELYTGVELIHGDRRPVGMLGREEPTSVLVDAPTAAYHQLTG